MSLYKLAQQIFFENESELSKILRGLTDQQFETYKGLLSQAHSDFHESGDIHQDEALWDAVNAVFVEGPHRELAGQIVELIGINNFKDYDFSSISTSLDALRSKAAEPEQVEAPVEKDPDLDLLNKYQSLNYEQYNLDENQKEKIRLQLDAMELIYGSIRSSKNPPQKVFYQRKLQTIAQTIDKILQETEIKVAPEELKEIKEDKEKLPLDKKPELKTVRIFSEEHSNAISSKLTPKTALEHPVFSEMESPIVLRDELPKFNYLAKKQMETRLIQYLGRLLDKMPREEVLTKGTYVGDDLIKEVNDLIYAIKTYDQTNLAKIKQAEGLIAQGKITKEQYNSYLDDLSRLSVNSIVKESEEIMKLLFQIVLYTGSPYLAPYYAGFRVLTSEGISNLNAQDEDVISIAAQQIEAQVRQKIKNLLDPTSVTWTGRGAQEQGRGEDSLRDFVSQTALQKQIIAQKVEEGLTVGGEIGQSRCPLCNKQIDWAFPAKLAPTAGYEAQLRQRRGDFNYLVQPYSLFRETKNPRGVEYSIITQDELRYQSDPVTKEMVEAKYDPPASLKTKDFNNPNTFIKHEGIYKGKKTWEQIQALINSSNIAEQEEGWHRRSAALQSHGAMMLTVGVKMHNLRFKCPADSTISSGCGLSLTASQPVSEEIGHQALQPTWTENPSRTSEWPSQALKDYAKVSQRGGFKFSSTVFACPCKIDDLGDDALGKFQYMAIPASGPIGYSQYTPNLPTKPDGTPDKDLLEDKGRMAYLVCGAATSLSSFNRDSTSEGFILNVLQKLYQSSPKDLMKLVNTLIKSGVDISEISPFLDQIDTDKGLEKTTSIDLRQDRMDKIAEIMVEAAQKISTKNNILQALSLVCPYGHKFTIGQSLDFGKDHVGMLIGKHYKSYIPVLASSGVQNAQELTKSGLLAKKSTAPGRRIKSYEDWSKLSYDQRDIKELSFFVPNEKGEMEEYILDQFKKPRKALWSWEETYSPPLHNETALVKSLTYREVYNKSGEDEDQPQRDVQDLNQSEEYEHREREIQNKKDLLMPGTSPNDLGSQITALGRSLLAVENIIQTWTKGLVGTDLLSLLAPEARQDLSAEVSALIRSLSNHILFFDEEGEPTADNAVKEQALQDLIQITYNQVQELIDDTSIAFQSPKKFAHIILLNAVKIGAEYSSNLEFNTHLPMEKFLSPLILEFVNSHPSLTKKMTPTYQRVKGQQEQTIKIQKYTSRMFLIGSAQYLADVVSNVYNVYFKDPGSPNYIGYNIGIDLSDKDKVLNPSDVSSIVISAEQLSEIERRKLVEPNVKNISPREIAAFRQKVSENITKAYVELRLALESTSEQSVRPYYINQAKQYVSGRLAGMTDLKESDIDSSLNQVFPISVMDFQSGVSSRDLIAHPHAPETPTAKQKRRQKKLPPAKQLTTFTDTEEIPSGRLDQAPAFVNKRLNYDSRKFQVGMFAPKPSNMSWPLDPDQEGFVGIPLPVVPISAQPAATAKVYPTYQFPLVNHKVLVRVPGDESSPEEKLDISFLFRRGRELEQTEELRKAQDNIFVLKRKLPGEIQKLRQKLPDDEKFNQKKASLEQRYQDEIRKYQLIIERIPLNVRTKIALQARSDSGIFQTEEGKQTSGEWESYPHPSLTLVDPTSAYHLIQNPELTGQKYAEGTKNKLISFIKEVYGLNKVRDILIKKISEVSKIPYSDISITDAELFSQSTNWINDKINAYYKSKKKTVDTDSMVKKILTKISADLNDNKLNYSAEAIRDYPELINETPGWKDHVGKFFDLIIDDPKQGGSYIQFVERIMGQSEPTFKTIPGIGNLATTLFGGNQSRSDIYNLVHQAQEKMIKYVETSMEMEILTKAQEKSGLFSKIAERAKHLVGIIKAPGSSVQLGPEEFLN